MIELISGIVVPVCLAIFGAAGWASDRSSKHIDRRFEELLECIDRNDNKIESVEKDLRDLVVRLPKEFVIREEFAYRMAEATKKMDYLVEQVDAIKNLLVYATRDKKNDN